MRMSKLDKHRMSALILLVAGTGLVVTGFMILTEGKLAYGVLWIGAGCVFLATGSMRYFTRIMRKKGTDGSSTGTK